MRTVARAILLPSVLLLSTGALVHGAAPLQVAVAPATPDEPVEHEVVDDLFAREQVARALTAQGLTPDEAEERLSRLSVEEIRYFADHVEQIRSAGSVPEYIWILLGVLLGVLILSAIF